MAGCGLWVLRLYFKMSLGLGCSSMVGSAPTCVKVEAGGREGGQVKVRDAALLLEV